MSTAVRTRSYRIVLPPPWVRVPLREGTEEAVTSIVEQVAATTPSWVPPDQVAPKKRELFRALLQRAAELRDRGGLDLYLPVDSIHGFTVRCSFVVSEVRAPEGDGSEGAAVQQELLREEGTRLEETAGDEEHGLPPTAWVRRARVVEPGEGADPALVVDWTAAVPGAEHTWLLSSFSASGTDARDPDGTAAMLVELFDAIMLTWRWDLVAARRTTEV